MDDHSPEKEKLISSFTDITSSSREVANTFLETHKWNLNDAVLSFTKNNEVAAAETAAEPNVSKPSDELLRLSSNLRIDIPVSSHSPSDDCPPSSRVRFFLSSKRKAENSCESQRIKRRPGVGNIYTLADLPSSDSDEDEEAELSVYTYTVTVWKNGFTVDDSELITLDDPEDAAFLEIISNMESPRELRPIRIQIKLITREEENFSESQDSFHGVGRTLAESDSASTESPALAVSPSMRLLTKCFSEGDESAKVSATERPEQLSRSVPGETVSAELQELPEGVETYTVTIWKNGFTLYDDQFMSLDIPENQDLLERIKRLKSPRLLKPIRLQVKLIRREEENFNESPAFQGVGRTLAGSDSVSSEPLAASLTTTPSPSIGLLVVDPAKPTTSIQLRYADGTQLVTRFNTHHTIRDIRGFMDASKPDGSKDYQLLIMGSPPKPLSDLDQTIEEAGIANSTLIQKF